MSSHSAQESGGSISASNEPATESSPSAKPTPTDAKSSDGTGPESPASTTCMRLGQTGANGQGISEGETPTLDGGTDLAIFTSNQRGEVRETDVVPALTGPAGLTQSPFILSAEDSPAKTSQSPGAVPDSRENAPASSSSARGSQLYSCPLGDGYSLRTFTDSFPQTVAGISESFSRRWANSGFTTSPGECWTADTSECPSDGDVSSSLPDVQEANTPPRFFLSPKAAVGILHRASERRRKLRPRLARALQALASRLPEEDRRTTPTSSEPCSEEDGSTTQKSEQATLWEPSAPAPGPAPTRTKSSAPSGVGAVGGESLTRKRQRETMSSSARRSQAQDTMQARTEPTDEPSSSTPPTKKTWHRASEQEQESSLRHLTPTERERLQGFPDGWTVVHMTRRGKTRAATKRQETP